MKTAATPETLDELEAQHQQEARDESQRDVVRTPRPLRRLLPKGGRLPTSEHWLERLYAGGRMAREKKPGVFDHLRSLGPWFVSVDDEPMSVLDAMSQTATVVAGFAEDPVVAAYVEGKFGRSALVAEDTSLGSWAVDAFAGWLKARYPAFGHVSFVNGGSESNEKALAMCRPHSRHAQARKVLAFEGSFHGRTLLPLHATWSPLKRGPFQLKGHEALFAPFPCWADPMQPEPEAPKGFLALAAQGDSAGLKALFGAGDALLAAEVEALAKVDEVLGSGECFACIIEPMQSEGGDRYATARFFKALRLLTRHHGVPLIFDEVQTGFGLGGTFFWHERFGLVDAAGRPDAPDAVTVAKRAQVGVVLSRFADPEPTSSHAASLVRGLIHAQMMAGSQDAAEVEAEVWPRLKALAARFPAMVSLPRARGFAFAFDAPSAEVRDRLISQRFWRGSIVFAAGSKTVRYRLSSVFGESDVAQVFEAIERSLAWVEEHPGEAPPAWLDAPGGADRGERYEAKGPSSKAELRVRVAAAAEADEVVRRIMALEEAIFEPARRDPEDRLRLGFDDPDGVVILAEAGGEGGWSLAGYAVATPLERVGDQPGPNVDPFLGAGNTLYSVAISVSPEFQGRGLGRWIKAAQVEHARTMKRADGAPRFAFITGRNRVGWTDAMQRINWMLGAHDARILDNQYGEAGAQAAYYRIPLGPPSCGVPLPAPKEGVHDMAGTVSAPFAQPPASLLEAERGGLILGPAVTKITICNYITPATVRAVEWACALVPELPHVYLTSGRDETVDKAIRTLRFHRGEDACVPIGLEGGYVGHTTAAARSLSDPGVHRQGAPVHDWPRIPHPARVGVAASLAALRATIEAAGGPSKVIGLFVEPLQERTGWVIPAAFWLGLEALKAELDLPVVFVETAGAYYRTGLGPFAGSVAPLTPDVMIWWPGGQQGFVHVNRRYFISGPLAMVSTWDGDELSMVRAEHQLKAARKLDLGAAFGAMEAAAEAARARGLGVEGLGLYRVLDAGEGAEALADALAARGVVLRRLPQGRLLAAPALDAAEAAARALEAALRA